MKRIWRPFWEWEEVEWGMWRKVSAGEHDAFLHSAIEFTGNAQLYGEWMLRVLDEWPLSCEHNLTDVGMNRRAWIGHAACCIGIHCPEDIVREAWWRLTQQQRDEADTKANIAIAVFERQHATKDRSIYPQLALPWVS